MRIAPLRPVPIMADYVWLTYKELAERLGIGADSARHKARRRKWDIQSGNHPRDSARVKVPLSIFDADQSPLIPLGSLPTEPLRAIPTAGGRDPHNDPHQPPKSPTPVISLADALAMVDAERARADKRIADTLAEERTTSARRLAEVQTMHLDLVNRLQAQGALERSLWLERVDAAELRAERVEQRLDQVLNHLLADRHQPPANKVELTDQLPWWQRWFGSSSKSDLGRG